MGRLKFLLALLFVAVSLASVSVYKLVHVGNVKDNTGNNRDVHKLDLKFGTKPSHPEYYPIVHLADKNGRPFCTAFVIDAHYAATAGHCVEEDGALGPTGKLRTETLRFLNEQNVDLKTEVKAVGFDEYTDYGLLLRGF